MVGPGGGQTLVSFPQVIYFILCMNNALLSFFQVPIKFPNNLKRPLADWAEKEKVWLNISHFPWPQDSDCSK